MIEIYDKKILEYYQKAKNSNSNDDLSTYQHYTKSASTLTLDAYIDTNTHTIKKLLFSKENATDIEQGVFFAFEMLIQEIPVIEAYDHATLIIERSLREHFSIRAVQGVVQIENSLELFQELQTLIRRLIQEYVQAHELAFNNPYNPPVSQEWSTLSAEQKQSRLMELAQRFIENNAITTSISITILNDRRVEMDFPDVAKKELPKLLFDFERYLSHVLDFHIEVMYAEKKDSNKKRQ